MRPDASAALATFDTPGEVLTAQTTRATKIVQSTVSSHMVLFFMHAQLP